VQKLRTHHQLPVDGLRAEIPGAGAGKQEGRILLRSVAGEGFTRVASAMTRASSAWLHA